MVRDVFCGKGMFSVGEVRFVYERVIFVREGCLST